MMKTYKDQFTPAKTRFSQIDPVCEIEEIMIDQGICLDIDVAIELEFCSVCVADDAIANMKEAAVDD